MLSMLQEGTKQARAAALDVGIDLEAWACELLRRIFTAADTLASGKDATAMGDEDMCAEHLRA